MKIFKNIVNIITTIIIVVIIVFLGLYLYGITPYIVLSGSMEPKIQTGSLSFINKNVKFESIKEKDIIAFKLDTGTMVTHRVVNITDKGLETKGDANNVNDDIITTKENYVGKNIFSIPKLGYAVRAIQTTVGKVVFGTIIVLLIVVGLLFGDDDKKKMDKKEKSEE
jgi:signal peptidase